MENHAYGQIFNNPNTPFINALAASANLATNFFAIGHPSLTNYLEMTGGSNFGVRSDNDPDWQSSTRYAHFSLLKSLEAALGLPCLNHACDPDVSVISDLFRTR